MTDFVKVGCRMANGLILRVSDWFESLEEPGKKILREIGTIELPGPVAQQGERPGQPADHAEADVDAAMADLWFAQNENSDLVTSGAVFKIEAPKAEPAKDDKASAKKDDDSKDRAQPQASKGDK